MPKTQKDIGEKQEGMWDIFKFFAFGAAGSVAGYLGFLILISLYSGFFLWIGLLILKRNTKYDEKTKKKKLQWTTGTYFGCFIIFLALLPWLPYLFQGMMLSIGQNIGSNIFEMIKGE